MIFFRWLRSCWRHPCGRILVVVFLLSLLGLVVLPQMIVNKAVVKVMAVVYQENDLQKVASSKQLVEMYPLSVTNTSRLVTSAAPPTQSAKFSVMTTASKTMKTENAKVSNQSLSISNNTLKNASSANQNDIYAAKKFLIYICDHKTYCYGIGDRQRGIASVYILAELTNRSFGIIMTSPSNFTEFYQPNLVPWDIPKSELEGKTSVEILAYGPRVHLGLHEIDFNKVYPQDVVYVRTNHKWHLDLLKNHHYRNRIPKWMNVPTWKIFQVAWLRLMTPTTTLRQELNEILVNIVQDMEDEYTVWHNLNNTKCCENKYINSTSCNNKTCDAIELQNLCCSLSSSNTSRQVVKTCSGKVCAKENNVTNCENVTCFVTNNTHCNNTTCTGLPTKETLIGFIDDDCVRYIENKTTNVTELSRLKPVASKYCDEKRPVLKPWMSVESVRKSQGYDSVNINLVCVHIRLGHSATLPLENNVRNKPDTVKAVWAFLKPLVASGQHVYLATDSQEVRQQAQNEFGNRVHVSSVPIVHIALVKRGQVDRSAFSLTLVEQFLLATSCKVLVVSYSGFSMKAAQIRDQIRGGAWDLYMFKNGAVVPKGVKWLLR